MKRLIDIYYYTWVNLLLYLEQENTMTTDRASKWLYLGLFSVAQTSNIFIVLLVIGLTTGFGMDFLYQLNLWSWLISIGLFSLINYFLVFYKKRYKKHKYYQHPPVLSLRSKPYVLYVLGSGLIIVVTALLTILLVVLLKMV